jgi:hypothetical protein
MHYSPTCPLRIFGISGDKMKVDFLAFCAINKLGIKKKNYSITTKAAIDSTIGTARGRTQGS